jgi:hypothetical protein
MYGEFFEKSFTFEKIWVCCKKRVRAEFDANMMSEYWFNFYQTKFIELAKS